MGKNNYNLGSYYLNNINFDVERYSKDKKTIADNIGFSVLNKMQSAFKWSGLPDTIPQKWLEGQLQVKGFITRADLEKLGVKVPAWLTDKLKSVAEGGEKNGKE